MATFRGTNGNNSWTVIDPGSFTIDGLGGVDTVDFGVMWPEDFTITQAPGGQVLVDSVSAASGQLHATLINIELLQFGNRSRTIDLRTYFQPTVTEITGTAGADLLQAAASGAQRIDGLGGIDTVALNGNRGDYQLQPKSGGGFALTREGSAAASIELQRVERLQFGDTKLALDFNLTNLTDPNTGRAGQVAMIIGAVFGRESVSNPGYVGVGLSLLDGGMSFEALTKLAIDFRLGAGYSTAQMVDLLYTNLVGAAPTPEVNKGYADLVDTGALTVAQLGVIAATFSLNLANINLTGLASTGLAYV